MLGARFDPRSNSLSLMRLVLASLVAVHHATAIGFGVEWGIGPAPVEGMSRLGDFAVDAFFVLSGFLVTMSYVRLDSPVRYLWHRALRILPGFGTCLVVTAVVFAPAIAVLEGRPALSVFPDAWRFVTANAFLVMKEWGVAGLPAGTHTPGVVNGALWTLFYEFTCYALVAALGVAGLLRRPRAVAALLTVVWLAQAASLLGSLDVPMPLLRRFLLLFLLGSVGYLFRDRLPITRPGLLGALVAFLGAGFLMPDYRVVGGPAFAYLLLGVMVLPSVWEPRADLSYGIYIWHWPVETLLVLTGVAARGAVPLVLGALALTVGAALASWTVVEEPALRLKSWTRVTDRQERYR